MARILTITNWYPPHHFGGYEVLCRDVMSSLQRRGHEIEVLCSDEAVDGADTAVPEEFPVHRRLRMYWRDGVPWVPSVGEQLAIERHNQRELAEALDRFAPDVVSVWHMGALSLNLLTAVARRATPMVYAICDEWLIYGMRLDPWSQRWNPNPFRRGAGRLVSGLTSVPTVVSDLGPTGCFCFLSEHTKEASSLASPWRFPVAPVIYPGIDLERFPLAGAEEASPWSGRLLSMGRLDVRKGPDTLLRALRLLDPSTTLSFLGRGERAERDRLAALAAELGVLERVRFDPIGSSQLAEGYRSHDCLVFPSEWPEPFGMVPLEAMASGLPVVATNVGGLAEYLVDEVNCLLIPPGDETALAKAVSRLAGDAGLRGRLRRGGLQTAAQFDIEWTAMAYERCHVAAAAHQLADLEIPPHPYAGTRSTSSPADHLRFRTRAKNWWRGWHR